MNYYDELGVRRDADTGEIRQAYRVLVRLLHPDAQTDEDLRIAAERQLNRLNAIVEILMDPERRRLYDRNLDLEALRPPGAANVQPVSPSLPPPPVHNSLPRRAVQHWSYIAVGVVSCSALCFYLFAPTDGELAAQPAAFEQTVPSVAATHPSPAARQPQPPQRYLPVQGNPEQASPATPPPPVRQTPLRASAAPKGLSLAAHSAEGAPATAERDHAVSAPAEARMASSTTPATQPRLDEISPALSRPSAPSGWAGNWFYTADIDKAPGDSRYRPVYIELLLSQAGETLAGNYRAQYNVPDQAISTQVVFHLEGKVGPDQRAKLGWTAVNGSKGQAEITLAPGGIMEFHWWCTELPKEASLISGRARLIRQRQP